MSPQSGEGYFDSLSLSFRGTLAAATTIALETMAALVQPLIWSDVSPRVVMRGNDLFALSTAFYGTNPAFLEGAAATTDTIFGLRIPLWVAVKPAESYGFSVTRVAVTNLSAEVLSMSLLAASKNPVAGRGRIDAREIPYTSLAATGQQLVTNKLPKVGKLLGLLCFATTVPTSGAVTGGIQEVLLDVGKDRYAAASWADLQAAFTSERDETAASATAMVKDRFLDNYGWLDFRDEPIDAVANDVSLAVDSQTASDPLRFIPVYEVSQ